MNRRKILVYLSGAYSGNIEANIQKARQTAIKLWELGYTVFTPHLNTIHFEKDCQIPYQDYLIGDLVILKRCDIIFMLDNWQISNGARQEYDLAIALNIPIVHNIEALEMWYAQKPTVTV